MSDPITPVSEHEKRSAANLWEVGYEYLVDSMRYGDTYTDRAHAAQTAALFFTAAQSRSLLDLVDRLDALVIEQNTGNLIAAYKSGALDSAEEYGRVRALIKGLLGPIEGGPTA
ncbi:hypothetical protein IU501_22950 [Nocardia otitidiscaviarum]|uniref:hypothetical protein n=1 Tax=Nocardia otitidiscaviarum TaxID=1823 RepID=UPI0004A72E80|nr:hypothetical protein [Nocardia otitidiscaviarum]MBF6135853.1 hypothetical protein [Nocardia otitidiscaviarum]